MYVFVSKKEKKHEHNKRLLHIFPFEKSNTHLLLYIVIYCKDYTNVFFIYLFLITFTCQGR